MAVATSIAAVEVMTASNVRGGILLKKLKIILPDEQVGVIFLMSTVEIAYPYVQDSCGEFIAVIAGFLQLCGHLFELCLLFCDILKVRPYLTYIPRVSSFRLQSYVAGITIGNKTEVFLLGTYAGTLSKSAHVPAPILPSLFPLSALSSSPFTLSSLTFNCPFLFNL